MVALDALSLYAYDCQRSRLEAKSILHNFEIILVLMSIYFKI